MLKRSLGDGNVTFRRIVFQEEVAFKLRPEERSSQPNKSEEEENSKERERLCGGPESGKSFRFLFKKEEGRRI